MQSTVIGCRFRPFVVALGTIAIVSILLSSCASGPPPPTYRQVLDSWLNGDINELIRNWGTPNPTPK